MKTVLLPILLVSLVSGVLSVFGAGGSFEKYMQYVCALLLTLVLLSPMVALTEGEIDFSSLFPEGNEVGAEKVPQAYLKHFENQVEQAVSQLLEERLSLDKKACLPIATAKDEEGMPILCRVEIRLFTILAAAKTASVRSLVEDACGCEVVIVEDVRV